MFNISECCIQFFLLIFPMWKEMVKLFSVGVACGIILFDFGRTFVDFLFVSVITIVSKRKCEKIKLNSNCLIKIQKMNQMYKALKKRHARL